MLSCGLAARSIAADPQPYSVRLAETGTAELDAALNSSSVLVSLRESAPVPPFGLIERARGDAGRLVTALNSFGYYQPEVTLTIAGRALDDPNLPALLDQTPQGREVAVEIAIATGPQFHLGNIVIQGTVPPYAQSALHLQPGEPAIAGEILGAQTRLLQALQEDGYALADVQEPMATADEQAHAIDVSFAVNTGERAKIGGIAFQGLMATNESFVRDALTLHTGDPYKPSSIEAARRSLAATGVFSGVSVQAAERLSPNGSIPITFDVQERPLHAVKLDGAYSTDLGISFSAGWSHRNLFGNGEQLNLLVAGTGVAASATDAIGYQLSAQFIKPIFLRSDQALQLDLSAVKQSLQAYNQTAQTIGATVRRKISPRWTASVGVSATHDAIVQKGVDRTYELLSFPVTATYDSTGITDLIQDATRGMRASFAVTPIQAFGARSLTFVLLQAAASAYFDLSGNGRSILALRGLTGVALGASNFDLPPDQRLYAGGSPTVRGFRYQSIGPLFPDGDPIGGTAVDAATIEFRQRLFGNFGAAAFVDAGQANDKGAPFQGNVQAGAGAGLRYYSSIGAVRLDVAAPLTRVPNGDRFEIYIGLGQAF